MSCGCPVTVTAVFAFPSRLLASSSSEFVASNLLVKCELVVGGASSTKPDGPYGKRDIQSN